MTGRARRRRRAGVVLASLLAVAAPARAVEVEGQVGLHVGYVFGHGWTAGPGLGFGRTFVSGRVVGDWPTMLVGGLFAAGDVSVDDRRGRPELRVHVGPELAAYHTCPALVIPVGVGVTWSYARGRRATAGWQGNLAFLVSPHPLPTYAHLAPAPTYLGGLSYRLVALSDVSPAHEVAADARVLFLPGSVGGLGYCGGD